MPKTSVSTPLFEDGLQSINFFNGRLLSAEDLTTERDASRQELRRLGIALGDGVVGGLEVRKAESSTADEPTVTVTPGIAINLYGATICLPKETDVSLLTVKTPPSASAAVRAFGDCKPQKAGTYRAGAGVYVLAIRPARGGTGLAPVSGLGNELAGCNTKYLVEGVRFVLLELPLDVEILKDVPRLRNRAAYACFGVGREVAFAADPFGKPPTQDTAIDKLRASGELTKCSVPLALVYWTANGVEFVDMWAVRRRADTQQAMHPWRRCGRDQEARFCQFQAQVADIVASSGNAETVSARVGFDYLPPVGVIPLSDAGVLRLNRFRFFDGVTCRDPVFMEGARLSGLLRLALAFPPIDLGSHEFVWLYMVRQNRLALDNAAGRDRDTPRPYLVFASGHLPYCGRPRFDLARWDYSSYGSCSL